MTDVPSGSSAAPKKAVGKAKSGGDGGADGKKRFEVKKVCAELLEPSDLY